MGGMVSPLFFCGQPCRSSQSFLFLGAKFGRCNIVRSADAIFLSGNRRALDILETFWVVFRIQFHIFHTIFRIDLDGGDRALVVGFESRSI